MILAKYERVCKAIRDSARGRDCTLRIPNCCPLIPADPTVVFCHGDSNSSGWGIKSPDFWGAYGCHKCHQEIDSKPKNKEAIWMLAIFETQEILVSEGLLRMGKKR